MGGVEPLSATRIRAWLETLPYDARECLFLLLEEVCAGLDLSRHNQFGFLRLRAELETSGELFGCTIAELRDAIRETLGDREGTQPAHPRSPLEELRTEVASRGHPDFR
jgi:hypothetical protein